VQQCRVQFGVEDGTTETVHMWNTKMTQSGSNAVEFRSRRWNYTGDVIRGRQGGTVLIRT